MCELNLKASISILKRTWHLIVVRRLISPYNILSTERDTLNFVLGRTRVPVLLSFSGLQNNSMIVVSL